MLGKGADVGVRITVIAAVLAGFGNVVSNTPTFNPLMEKISSTPIPVLFICLVIVAVICAITSNSNGGYPGSVKYYHSHGAAGRHQHGGAAPGSYFCGKLSEYAADQSGCYDYLSAGEGADESSLPAHLRTDGRGSVCGSGHRGADLHGLPGTGIRIAGRMMEKMIR